MNNKIIVFIVVIVLIIGGYWFYKNNKALAPTETEVESNMPVPGSSTEENIEEVDATVEMNVKKFTVDASPFKFVPSTMTVNKGDTVKITVKNTQGTHDLKIDEFNASTRILNASESQTITFVADKTGVFEYYCSVGSHRAMGMWGTITVK